MTLEIVSMIVLLFACIAHGQSIYNKIKKQDKYVDVLACFILDIILLVFCLLIESIFLSIVAAIIIGMDLSKLFTRKSNLNAENTDEEQAVLKPASERYKEAETPQFANYIKKIANSTSCGEEYCYLLSGSNSPMRKNHIELLTAQGYDIHLSRYKDIVDEKEHSYFVKCY